MKKIRMAIISSYSESCGNAAFTKVLHDSIEHYHKNIEVEVVELNLQILQSIDSIVRRSADAHIDRICKSLVNFDFVNIQMETGLYGTMPSDIINRFHKIIKTNKVTSVTLHSPRLISSNPLMREGIKKIIKGSIKTGMNELLSTWYSNVHYRINRKIIKLTMKYNSQIIVHTERAKNQIETLFDYKNIIVHPLKLVGPSYIYKSKTFRDVKQQLNLENTNCIFIGMFGYISQYKGHVQALQALELLPKQYKLLFFGRQHPQTLKSDGRVDAYLEHLIHRCNTTIKLKNRVYFLGELNDNDFLDVVSDIDVSWLPYFENGQDGSGIASICLDLCARVVCSTSFAFDELFKLINYKNSLRFDIGNINELALKTEILMKKIKPQKPYFNENIFNLRTQAAVYIHGISDDSQELGN
jgi:glycosyltransferase involved in cell wall biosynthesis